MNLDKIETELIKISSKINKDSFIYDFLLAYGLPKSSINRLKKGDYNQSKNNGEIIWAKKIYFKPILQNEDVHDVIDEISKTSEIEKNKIRFIIVTDFKTFLSKDIKTSDTLDIELPKLNESLNFFLPLIGREKIILDKENPADIKAANQMGKLYDQIIKDNPDYNLGKYRDHLNLFFTRLLFLYYADDSEIFKKNKFFGAVTEFSEKDGSDLDNFFNNLFVVLNKEDRSNVEGYLKEFPYVNGNLFHGKITLPKFTKITRQLIINGASLDWAMINPDILGSMLQAIVSPEERNEEEMHYTSVSNILKVINPLFLDDISQKIDDAENDEKKLKKILKYIYNLKIFDPACGSGNFLIISYKHLCLLEIKIFKHLFKTNPDDWKLSVSGISLNQFYGIEKSNYAAETSKLSLWLAEHQMNLLFKEIFGSIKPSLPLREPANIICKNSIDLDWNNFCIKEKNTSYIYLVGNPPFKGFSERNNDQQNDIIKIFGKSSKADYVSLWFFKGAEFLSREKLSALAFVSTNSINQGEQVEIVWEKIFKKDLEISFAYKSFNWKNNAKNNAGVTVSIIGVHHKSEKKKSLFINNLKTTVPKINPYLIGGNNLIIKKTNKPISKFLPQMTLGDMAKDGSGLILDKQEYENIITNYPDTKKYLKKFVGGIDFLRGVNRWCIWANDKDYEYLNKIEFFKKRFEIVKKARINSRKKATQKFSKLPYRFVEIRKKFNPAIIVPTTSSERRKYLPVGYLDKDSIITAPNQVVYDAPLFLFSILSSRMHCLWLETVGGKLRTDYRYSSEIVYNTFPIKNLKNSEIDKLDELALQVIDEREKNSEKTISELYDPKIMPVGLQNLHQKIDILIESFYSEKEIYGDNDRIEILFKYYEIKMNNDKLI
jgi:hypothetical protein